jgi:pimeloyl-ACP methyl ester carboxylesterase
MSFCHCSRSDAPEIDRPAAAARIRSRVGFADGRRTRPVGCDCDFGILPSLIRGRSTRTPGRYTLDNMGNDLVRFLDLVIGRPAIVSGLSSGGVLAAWLSAYAKPGQVLAALYEDPPLFASEVRPSVGPGIRQCIGPLFDLWSTFLGDQWSIGAWDAMREGSAARLLEHIGGLVDAPGRWLVGTKGEYPPFEALIRFGFVFTKRDARARSRCEVEQAGLTRPAAPPRIRRTRCSSRSCTA